MLATEKFPLSLDIDKQLKAFCAPIAAAAGATNRDNNSPMEAPGLCDVCHISGVDMVGIRFIDQNVLQITKDRSLTRPRYVDQTI